MQSLIRCLLSCTTLFFAAQMAGARGDEPKTLEPLRSWGDILDGKDKEALSKDAPPNKYVDNEKDWSRLWKAWHGDKKLPAVDFAKEVVLVEYVRGNAGLTITATLDRTTGNLVFANIQSLKGGPGFSYTIWVVGRDGVKSVNGHRLK